VPATMPPSTLITTTKALSGARVPVVKPWHGHYADYRGLRRTRGDDCADRGGARFFIGNEAKAFSQGKTHLLAAGIACRCGKPFSEPPLAGALFAAEFLVP